MRVDCGGADTEEAHSTATAQRTAQRAAHSVSAREREKSVHRRQHTLAHATHLHVREAFISDFLVLEHALALVDAPESRLADPDPRSLVPLLHVTARLTNECL
eukprot:3093729-Rhodomonas_salina.1